MISRAILGLGTLAFSLVSYSSASYGSSNFLTAASSPQSTKGREIQISNSNSLLRLDPVCADPSCQFTLMPYGPVPTICQGGFQGATDIEVNGYWLPIQIDLGERYDPFQMYNTGPYYYGMGVSWGGGKWIDAGACVQVGPNQAHVVFIDGYTPDGITPSTPCMDTSYGIITENADGSATMQVKYYITASGTGSGCVQGTGSYLLRRIR